MEHIPIIFEDDNILVVNKPSGLVVHSDGKHSEATLVDWAVSKYPEMQGVGEPMTASPSFPLETKNSKLETPFIDRSGIVHRLDKDTSGVMVLAKNQQTHQFLKAQFQDRTIQKKYLCVVWGNIKEESGIIDAPIGKSRKDFRQWQAGDKGRGILREAYTEFRVLKRIQENGEHFCVVEVSPKTGRTHQIRVHMKYIHHPLVGDSLYASERPLVLGFDRLALHAQKISLVLPNGEQKTFEAPIPPEFEKVL